ncbi:expressed unknown protein [Seminavis robusta]|uniref:Uncharacterized protein n=1 Tax=Seminavis robusta TaxID=568900 RepID=A0A9N8DAI8_9STRA|nr:expressed unknown protein [Seminavis robusta]|eukprot:Sro33_g021730.1 n/a (546) ;mRNA; f:151791-153428
MALLEHMVEAFVDEETELLTCGGDFYECQDLTETSQDDDDDDDEEEEDLYLSRKQHEEDCDKTLTVNNRRRKRLVFARLEEVQEVDEETTDAPSECTGTSQDEIGSIFLGKPMSKERYSMSKEILKATPGKWQQLHDKAKAKCLIQQRIIAYQNRQAKLSEQLQRERKQQQRDQINNLVSMVQGRAVQPSITLHAPQVETTAVFRQSTIATVTVTETDTQTVAEGTETLEEEDLLEEETQEETEQSDLSFGKASMKDLVHAVLLQDNDDDDENDDSDDFDWDFDDDECDCTDNGSERGDLSMKEDPSEHIHVDETDHDARDDISVVADAIKEAGNDVGREDTPDMVKSKRVQEGTEENENGKQQHQEKPQKPQEKTAKPKPKRVKSKVRKRLMSTLQRVAESCHNRDDTMDDNDVVYVLEERRETVDSSSTRGGSQNSSKTNSNTNTNKSDVIALVDQHNDDDDDADNYDLLAIMVDKVEKQTIIDTTKVGAKKGLLLPLLAPKSRSSLMEDSDSLWDFEWSDSSVLGVMGAGPDDDNLYSRGHF